MDKTINKALQYIHKTLGIEVIATPLLKGMMKDLPLYIHESYLLYTAKLFNNEIILAKVKNGANLSIQQTKKHLQLIKSLFDRKIVIVLDNIESYNRKRLIEKGISFIIPDKQLYLPDLLVDIRESHVHPKTRQKGETLLPSSQFLFIYHIIHRYNKWKLEDHSFKEIARKFKYTPMAITNAIDILKYHELIEVHGGKEKYIRFKYDRQELWSIAKRNHLLVNPVLKTVYSDIKPKEIFLLRSNASALPEYTDMNSSKQQYYAIEKNTFYDLQRSNVLLNLNDTEGHCALEIWKYNPLTLVDELPNDLPVVDPLSLYLSLESSNDERVEIALDQILEKFIW